MGIEHAAGGSVFRLVVMALFFMGQQVSVPAEAAQDGSTAATPRFDVVSVKPSVPLELSMQANTGVKRFAWGGFRYTPGRLTSNLPLRSLITEAYSVKSWQVPGPDWLGVDRYDLAATMPADTPKAIARLMLRTMLAERFGLKFHVEKKVYPVYALVVGKSGFSLEPVPDPGQYDQKMSPGRFMATAIAIGRFAEWLTSITDRPVIDMTGITGAYKLDLEWTPDYQEEPRRWDAGVFEAVKRLGLKLEARRAPVEFFVIDHVSRVPTAN
jgi:uncharacterized protein (TIGR03435 family)